MDPDRRRAYGLTAAAVLWTLALIPATVAFDRYWNAGFEAWAPIAALFTIPGSVAVLGVVAATRVRWGPWLFLIALGLLAWWTLGFLYYSVVHLPTVALLLMATPAVIRLSRRAQVRR